MYFEIENINPVTLYLLYLEKQKKYISPLFSEKKMYPPTKEKIITMTTKLS